jgi:predicted 2-oxoglutarate/Fe(II)-dependent dioxygenase YbiX
MIEITDTVYRVVAARLREQIATAEWFNGVIELPPAAPAPSAASP